MTPLSLPNTPSPRASVTISHPLNPQSNITCEGIVDTGFTGFLRLPERWWMTVALHAGSVGSRFANGDVAFEPAGYVWAQYGTARRLGFAIASKGQDALIGAQFLAQFDLGLLWSPKLGSCTLFPVP